MIRDFAAMMRRLRVVDEGAGSIPAVSTLLGLPQPVLRMVIGYLDTATLEAITNVCMKLRRLIDPADLRGTFNMGALLMRTDVPRVNQFVQLSAEARRAFWLRQLVKGSYQCASVVSFSTCLIRNEELREVGRRCRSVRHLDLSHVALAPGFGSEMPFPVLDTLNLSHTSFRCDGGLPHLFLSLTTIRLGFTAIDDTDLSLILDQCLMLRSIDVSGCRVGCRYQVARTRLALESLIVTNTQIDDAWLSKISDACGQICELDVTGCRSLSEDGFSQCITKHASTLRRLAFSRTGLSGASGSILFPNLREVDAESTLLTADALRRFFTVPLLSTINVANCIVLRKESLKEPSILRLLRDNRSKLSKDTCRYFLDERRR